MLFRGLFPNNEEDPGPKIADAMFALVHCVVFIAVVMPQVPTTTKVVLVGGLPWFWYQYQNSRKRYDQRKKYEKEQFEFGMRYLDWVEANKRKAATDASHGLTDDKGPR